MKSLENQLVQFFPQEPMDGTKAKAVHADAWGGTF
jgi:hypothetical protein